MNKTNTTSEEVSRRLFLRTLGIGAIGSMFLENSYAKWLSQDDVSRFVAAAVKSRYYAHEAVIDAEGVIAPWYKQLNGQCDFRVRIAAETLKRYPWTTKENAIAEYPDYLFTSKWKIDKDGTITTQDPGDWQNGDLGQRSTSVLRGMVDYYRYTGDAAAIAHMTYMGDFLIDHSLTPADHSWPRFPISVPVKGKAYYKANPKGMIQLDICGGMGYALLKAYQVTGKQKWFETAKHWGDVFAEKCNFTIGTNPWPRYANPEDAFADISNKGWREDPRFNLQTGGVTMIMAFLDELMRLGYRGKNNSIAKARNAGLSYLKDVLLPKWTADDTWGLFFWDWLNYTQNCSTTADVAAYMLNNKADFPNWETDTRNIMTLFLNRSSANPASGADVYNGAWAYPESSSCCGNSLWYAPLFDAPVQAQYGVEANNDWMKELAYRQMILQTYDVHETGVTEDNINGGVYVNGIWLNIAHPLPLLWVLNSIGWLPEELGASRENHVVRCTSVVNDIKYGKGNISYSTFDAPKNMQSVLRLSFTPTAVMGNGKKLQLRTNLAVNGYIVKKLPNGDSIITIRHDGLKNINILGVDPQHILKANDLKVTGAWEKQHDKFVTKEKNAAFQTTFTGNQVRVVGRFDNAGGKADVFIDGEKQLVPIDFWNPSARNQQLLYYKNGLSDGAHTLKIVALGEGNPYSTGQNVYIDHIQTSAESKNFSYPTATGPKGFQRMVFGYPKRKDYKDIAGNLWRPATEIITRVGSRLDTVKICWLQEPVSENISGTQDQELYKYGYHAPEFWINITVGPGVYDLCLKFAATRGMGDVKNSFDILINGQSVVQKFDVASTAGKANTAVDLVFNHIKPYNGIIEVRLKANDMTNGKAFIQALEIGNKINKKGATPVSYKS